MPAANGIYKIAVIGTVAGQRHIHTLHFRSTLAGSAVGMAEDVYLADLLSTWQTGCRTAYRAVFSTSHAPVQQYQIRKVCGGVPLPAGSDVAESAGNQGGTINTGAVGGGEEAAPWLASVVTERTALAGRRYRGRFFLGGLYEGFIQGADVVSTRVSTVQAYADALVATFVTPLETTVNGKLFVFSRTQSLVPGTQCQQAGADVRSLQPRTTLATMKSRKAGSGI